MKEVEKRMADNSNSLEVRGNFEADDGNGWQESEWLPAGITARQM